MIKFEYNGTEYTIDSFSVCGELDDVQIDWIEIVDDHGITVQDANVEDTAANHLLNEYSELLSEHLFDKMIMQAEDIADSDR